MSSQTIETSMVAARTAAREESTLRMEQQEKGFREHSSCTEDDAYAQTRRPLNVKKLLRLV